MRPLAYMLFMLFLVIGTVRAEDSEFEDADDPWSHRGWKQSEGKKDSRLDIPDELKAEYNALLAEHSALPDRERNDQAVWLLRMLFGHETWPIRLAGGWFNQPLGTLYRRWLLDGEYGQNEYDVRMSAFRKSHTSSPPVIGGNGEVNQSDPSLSFEARELIIVLKKYHDWYKLEQYLSRKQQAWIEGRGSRSNSPTLDAFMKGQAVAQPKGQADADVPKRGVEVTKQTKPMEPTAKAPISSEDQRKEIAERKAAIKAAVERAAKVETEMREEKEKDAVREAAEIPAKKRLEEERQKTVRGPATPTDKPPVEPKATEPASKNKPGRLFILKDGSQIAAKIAAEMDGRYFITDIKGNRHEISVGDVEKIVEEENAK